MFKILITIFISISFLFVDVSADKLELTANSLETTQDTVYANEGVVVYYNDSIIKSKQATYNKKTKLLVLDGEVEIIGYEGTKEYTNHMELQTDTKEAIFKQLFLAGENDIWLLANKAHKKKGLYILGRSMLSSCDVNNPLWKMVFSDSLYNSNEKYMKIYNAKVYLWDIPIFYTPYLAFSTSKERTSGLLFPKVAYTPSEGIMYEQPIFWNIAKNMDLEINPQIRALRSMGVYSTFRFVDSDHSDGTLRAGYFKDTQSYIDEFSPLHDDHYGIEFNYESSSVFKKYLSDDVADGLYVNTTYLNDIDYLNLQKSRLRHFGIRPRQESRINYFLYNESYYAGINTKYFIDTRAENNNATLQQLPSFQWHKYLNTFLLDNLMYSVDTHVNNITRRVGITMKQAEIKVPIEYSTSFFDNYANLLLSNEFYYSKYFFGNDVFKNDNFQYYSNIQKLSLFTDLTKKYNDVTHVVQPSIEYTNPGTDKQSPVDYESLSVSQKKLFAVGLPEETISFGLKQYLYDEKMNLFFFQRLAQRYYAKREYKLSELENEMQYNFDDWKFYNYVLYSHEYSAIHAMVSSIELEGEGFDILLGHSYKQYLKEESNSVATNDINLNFKYKINNRVVVNGGFAYDIENTESKQWRVGIGYFRDCWSIDTSIKQEIRASSSGPENLRTFYVQLNFKPFGSVGTGNFGVGTETY